MEQCQHHLNEPSLETLSQPSPEAGLPVILDLIYTEINHHREQSFKNAPSGDF